MLARPGSSLARSEKLLVHVEARNFVGIIDKFITGNTRYNGLTDTDMLAYGEVRRISILLRGFKQNIAMRVDQRSGERCKWGISSAVLAVTGFGCSNGPNLVKVRRLVSVQLGLPSISHVGLSVVLLLFVTRDPAVVADRGERIVV